MRWFRTRTQFGARLALIAVALQLVLTFGHVHAPSGAVTSAVQTSQSNGTVPNPGHKGLADFECLTCALIQLSAISAPSLAPQLPLPLAVDYVTLRPNAEMAPATASQASFRARAPPAA